MNITQTIFNLLMTCVLFLGLFSASSLVFKRRNGRMFSLFLLNVCLFVIAFGYLMTQNSSSLGLMENWDIVKLSAVMLFCSVWVFTALDLTRRHLKSRPLIIMLLGLFSLSFIALRLSDGAYHLFYVSLTQTSGTLIGGLISVKGPAYIYFTLYFAIGCSVAFLVYLEAAVRYIGKLRRQYILFSLIALIPLVGLVAQMLNLAGTGFDFLSLGAISGISFLSLSVLSSDYKSVETKAKELLFKQSDDPLILIDEAGRLLDFNASADLMFPELDRVFTGKPLKDILIRGNPLFQRVDHPMKPDLEVKHDNGSSLYEVRSSQVSNSWGRPIGRLIRLVDVTRKRQESEAMHRLATRDSLTGLLNRRQFLSLAKLAFDRNQIDNSGLALILFDIDHFAQINTQFGVGASDEALRLIGSLLIEHFRKSDLVGRFGGEEFAVLLPSTQASDAEKLAQRFCSKIRETNFPYMDAYFRLTFSGGVVATPGEEADLESLLKSAYVALRESKETGRDRVSVSVKSKAI